MTQSSDANKTRGRSEVHAGRDNLCLSDLCLTLFKINIKRPYGTCWMGHAACGHVAFVHSRFVLSPLTCDVFPLSLSVPLSHVCD